MPRRIVWTVLAVLVLALAGCAGAEVPPAVEAPAAEAPAAEAPAVEEPAAEAPAAAAPSLYQEAPMLTERVNAGELPPVDERLPEEPFVVGPGVLVPEDELPDWQPGTYGGVMQAAHAVANWAPDVFIMLNEHLLMAPGIGVEGIRPNLVRSFEISDDNQVFTFELRKGRKWSDGEPVTTEDVRFVYEDIYLNEELTPAFPARFRSAGNPEGEPMQLEIVDDHIFRISFDEPYGGFLREITIKGWQGYTDLMRPAHYLKQFHPTYTPMEELQPLMEEQNLEEEWWNLFNLRDCTNWELTNPICADYPSLYPWVGVPSSDGVLTFERNPYYHRVDTLGQQLPYIDRVVSVQVEDVEMVNLRVLTGDVDLLRESTALVNLPLYMENAEQAGFRIVLLDTHVDPSALFINQTYDDPVWQEVVGDVRFRQALNMAINRQEIIDSVYFGLASLPALVPSDYNLDEANRLLDEMGMDERDADGFRIGPDGNTFTFPIESGAHAPDLMPMAELLVEHFQEIGIRTTLRRIDSQLFGQRGSANELQASVLWSVQPMWRDGTWTDYIPQNLWGQQWQIWYNTGGSEGVEPPAEVQEIYRIHEGRVAALPYSAEDIQLTEELYQIHYDNVFILNIAENVNYALVINSQFGNVQSAGQAIGANNSGEQFFFME